MCNNFLQTFFPVNGDTYDNQNVQKKSNAIFFRINWRIKDVLQWKSDFNILQRKSTDLSRRNSLRICRIVGWCKKSRMARASRFYIHFGLLLWNCLMRPLSKVETRRNLLTCSQHQIKLSQPSPLLKTLCDYEGTDWWS